MQLSAFHSVKCVREQRHGFFFSAALPFLIRLRKNSRKLYHFCLHSKKVKFLVSVFPASPLSRSPIPPISGEGRGGLFCPFVFFFALPTVCRGYQIGYQVTNEVTSWLPTLMKENGVIMRWLPGYQSYQQKIQAYKNVWKKFSVCLYSVFNAEKFFSFMTYRYEFIW